MMMIMSTKWVVITIAISDDDGDDDVSGVGVEGDSWKLIRRLDYYLGPRVHNYLKGWRLVVPSSAIFYLT